MAESAVWTAFKRAWPEHCERIEPGIGAGIPDVLVTDGNGRAGLIELKDAKRLTIRPSQIVWHRRWQAAGCASVVLTRHPVTRSWHWWIDDDMLHRELTIEGASGAAVSDGRMVTAIREVLFRY